MSGRTCHTLASVPAALGATRRHKWRLSVPSCRRSKAGSFLSSAVAVFLRAVCSAAASSAHVSSVALPQSWRGFVPSRPARRGTCGAACSGLHCSAVAWGLSLRRSRSSCCTVCSTSCSDTRNKVPPPWPSRSLPSQGSACRSWPNTAVSWPLCRSGHIAAGSPSASVLPAPRCAARRCAVPQLSAQGSRACLWRSLWGSRSRGRAPLPDTGGLSRSSRGGLARLPLRSGRAARSPSRPAST